MVDLRPAAARLQFISTVTGAPLSGEKLDGHYWWRNVREPVAFDLAVETLLDQEYDVLVEIGPHPVLSTYLRRLTAGRTRPAAVVSTCGRDGTASGPDAVRRAVGNLLACGARPDWSAFFPRPARVVGLPGYPWQRQRHWNGDPRWWNRTGEDAGASAYRLLGDRLPTAEPTWCAPLEPARLPWPADHKVGDAVVLPAAAYLESAVAAARECHAGPVEVRTLNITRALVLPQDADDPVDVHYQVALSEDDHSVRITSRTGTGGEWRQHARGRARRLLAAAPAPRPIATLGQGCVMEMSAAEHYARLATQGLPYGPAFRILTHLTAGEDEVVATYSLRQPGDGFHIHPAILDGALQAGAALLAAADTDPVPFLPAEIETARVWHQPSPTGYIHVRARHLGALEACWDVTILDEDGRVTVEMEGCLLRRYAGAGTLAPPERYETVLRAAPRPHPDDTDERSLLPAPQSLLDASAGDRMRALAPLTTDSGAGADRTAVSRLKEVCAHFAAAAVGRFADGAPEFTVGDLVAAGVQEPYRRLLHLLLSLAQEYGLAEPAESAPGGGQRWRLIGVPRPDDMHRSLLNDHPGQAVIATVYGRCGLHLADVLRGAHNPHELLFADADRHLVEQLYHQALGLAGHHRAARELLRAAVRAWPADRPLRILEAGAGTGGATGWLLEVLPPERTQSVFTDISAAFFPRARARFRSYDFVDYRTLDLDRGLEEQGFTPGSFDLVVAHNVPHAAKDLRACLDRVAWLLADDGQLMATEQHDPAFLVLCFGLLPSFSSLLLARRTGTTRVPSTSALEPRPPSPAAAADWVIVAENPEADLAQALASTLSTSGRATVRQAAGTTGPDRLPSSTTTEPVPSRAVLLLDDGPDAPWSAPGAAAATALAAHRIATLTGLAAAADAETAAEGAKPELWLVTRPRGAQPAPEAATHPQDAAVWGAARGLANEHPGLTVRRISLERGTDPGADACRLAAELSAPDAEDEVVLTRAGRFTPRITALSASPRAVQPADDGSGRYRLEFHDPGLSHRLSWTPMAPCAPGPDEVLIEVRAAGLNYRDVMRATGLLASGAAQQNLGLECAGVVAQVGSRVADLAVGDRVFAMAMPALASQVVAHRSLVGRMPDGVGFAAAATVPVACLTVRYALGGLARLRPDDTLLVHGAAGGVGLAALQFARDRGTQVIATAGTPAKRDLLRLLGVTRVADSRAADFADHVRDLTAGQGVDVVLNSLAGEGLTRSLELLKAGGRFVELGKRDIDVRGVVHAAMVLDDAQLAQLSQERVQAVLGPKMHGTLLLDAYTTNCDLDFFVAYSSLSALVGNAGQGPYAAANLFLEALARARRRTGKPAPAIAWGAIGETGYVARHQEMAQAVQRWGLEDVSPAEACAALDDVLARGPAVVGIGRVDWARAGRVLPENGLRVLRD